jgi:hypothetical protein
MALIVPFMSMKSLLVCFLKHTRTGEDMYPKVKETLLWNYGGKNDL